MIMKTINEVNVKDLSLDESYELVIRLKDMLTADDDDQLMELPLSTLIRYCKAIITPNEAGFKLEKYIIKKCCMRPIASKYKLGDCVMGLIYLRNAEIKISFEGKTSQFTIRNIRAWHKIDFYILCLIPKKTLEPKFFVVKLDKLLSEYTTSFMAGTVDENKENKNSNLGITIPNTPKDIRYLESINLADGTNFENLMFFTDNIDKIVCWGHSEVYKNAA